MGHKLEQETRPSRTANANSALDELDDDDEQNKRGKFPN